jgi:predicted O-methyltransferase YrrM
MMKTLASPIPKEARQDAWRAQRATLAARHLRNIPALPPEELFEGIDDLEITLRHRFEPRGLPHGDAYVLSLITAWARPRLIFEIGTGTGEGTVLMLRQAPDAHVHTLDLGDEDTATLGVKLGDAPLEGSAVGRAWHGTQFEGQVTQHLGDSARFDFSPFAGEMDLVFVDGAHTAEYVTVDSHTALRLVRPGGVIVWDDCHLFHAGVPKALVDFRREGHDVRRVASSRLAVLRA